MITTYLNREYYIFSFFIIMYSLFLGTTNLYGEQEQENIKNDSNAKNALSKITITSGQATMRKSQTTHESLFIATYEHNVVITFADNAEMKGDRLDVTMITETESAGKNQKLTTTSAKKSSGLKTIKLSGNISLKKASLWATADNLNLTFPDRLCHLEGHIHVVKSKEKPTDIPVDISGNKATIDLISLTATLIGTTEQPVHTIVSLDNHPITQKKTLKKI